MSIKFFLVGHVNMGKSTLGGHLLKRVGAVETHRIKTYASLLDIDLIEQETGNTHESTSMEFTYRDTNFILYDTPGHRGFVNSLISIIEPQMTAVLVVSVVPNEFEAGMNGGQLKEQLRIIHGMGVQNLILVCNKMDRIDNDISVAKKTLFPFAKLISKYGYTKEHVKVTYASGKEGAGIEDLLDKLIEFGSPSINPVSPIETSSLTATMTVYENDTYDVITAGYRCNLHHGGEEVGCTIEFMEPSLLIKDGNIQATFSLDRPLLIKGTRSILGNSRCIFGYLVLDR